MSDTVIRVENLSKLYRLGLIGSRTLRDDLNRWWTMKVRRNPDPLMRIGEPDHNNRMGEMLWALRDVSFEVKQGEILGIIGRNGAGKSTLLKILSRVTAPTAGKVKIRGRVGSLLEVGTGFHPELTGRENIYLNGAIHGMKRTEISSKLDEIVDFAEIEQFLDTPVKRYSSGMYVRLAFAVAAHLEPEILVVDEVLAVGDAAFQRKCLGKMGKVATAGRTVLFVSHNMAAMQSLCDTAILLQKGCLASHGNTLDIVDRYLKNQSILSGRTFIRSGDVDIILRDINRDEKPQKSVMMGEKINFQIILRTERPIKNAALGLGFETASADRVLTLHTHFQCSERWNIAHDATLYVEWPECILNIGTYNIVAALYESNHMVSFWDSIGHLHVVASDYFGTGKIPDPQRQGKVVSRAIWTIQSDSDSAIKS